RGPGIFVGLIRDIVRQGELGRHVERPRTAGKSSTALKNRRALQRRFASRPPLLLLPFPFRTRVRPFPFFPLFGSPGGASGGQGRAQFRNLIPQQCRPFVFESLGRLHHFGFHLAYHLPHIVIAAVLFHHH